MKKDSNPHTSQDYDRKHHQGHHHQDHISHNPRAAKDLPGLEDSGATSEETADLISKGHTITDKPPLNTAFTEDMRKTIRHEDTNHFTNREGHGEKK